MDMKDDKFNKLEKFEDYLAEQLSDPEFKKEYDALEPEFSLIKALMEARAEKGLTQKDLAEKTGISQGDISRIERGSANPSIKTIQRIATALDKKVQILFV